MTMAGNGLVKLLEELGELAQVAAKKLAYMQTDMHPDGKSLKARMEEEMADVYAACSFVTAQFGLDDSKMNARVKRKLELFNEWHARIDN
jgi:NTP pyrophosphatase (non-canonical NTP hydrolase)